jgi:chromosome segregation ATPase
VGIFLLYFFFILFFSYSLNQQFIMNENLNKELNEFKLKYEKLEIDFDKLQKNNNNNKESLEINNNNNNNIDLLNNKIDELKIKLDLEIKEKEELLNKSKEINDECCFLKRIYNQEVDSLKEELKNSKNTISNLGNFNLLFYFLYYCYCLFKIFYTFYENI